MWCVRTSRPLDAQLASLAMGSPLSPIEANLYMEHLSNQSATLRPKMWLWYVDNTFVVWQHGVGKVHIFLQPLNNQHPDIRFTMEVGNEYQAIPFLNTRLTPWSTYQTTVPFAIGSTGSPLAQTGIWISAYSNTQQAKCFISQWPLGSKVWKGAKKKWNQQGRGIHIFVFDLIKLCQKFFSKRGTGRLRTPPPPHSITATSH